MGGITRDIYYQSDNRFLNSNDECRKRVIEYLPKAEKNYLTWNYICRKTIFCGQE